MVAFFFPPRDLALIHSHSSDVLAPKGPCPVVTEQLPSPPSLSYRPACSAKKKKGKKKPRRKTAAKLFIAFSAQSETVKKSSHLTFCFAFIVTYFILLFVSFTGMFSSDFLVLLHCSKPLS